MSGTNGLRKYFGRMDTTLRPVEGHDRQQAGYVFCMFRLGVMSSLGNDLVESDSDTAGCNRTNQGYGGKVGDTVEEEERPEEDGGRRSKIGRKKQNKGWMGLEREANTKGAQRYRKGLGDIKPFLIVPRAPLLSSQANRVPDSSPLDKE